MAQLVRQNRKMFRTLGLSVLAAGLAGTALAAATAVRGGGQPVSQSSVLNPFTLQPAPVAGGDSMGTTDATDLGPPPFVRPPGRPLPPPFRPPPRSPFQPGLAAPTDF